MKKLYDYGTFMLEIGQTFKVPKTGWFLKNKAIPATKAQQAELVRLGWGKQKNMSKHGVDVLIDAIKND